MTSNTQKIELVGGPACGRVIEWNGEKTVLCLTRNEGEYNFLYDVEYKEVGGVKVAETAKYRKDGYVKKGTYDFEK